MEKIVRKLKKKNKTVATMESCTGGFIAHSITNISGSSDVFSFGAVTYSNDAKIMMGVDPKIIEKYTVYSKEVAIQMAMQITHKAGSDYGIGVTGKLNKPDKKNDTKNNNIVYFAIYDKTNEKLYSFEKIIENNPREENKYIILKTIENCLLGILEV